MKCTPYHRPNASLSCSGTVIFSAHCTSWSLVILVGVPQSYIAASEQNQRSWEAKVSRLEVWERRRGGRRRKGENTNRRRASEYQSQRARRKMGTQGTTARRNIANKEGNSVSKAGNTNYLVCKGYLRDDLGASSLLLQLSVVLVR